MINEFFKNITLASFTLEMIRVSNFMTFIISGTDIIGAWFANRNSYIQEIMNILTIIINNITLCLIATCLFKGITININEVVFFGVIYICAMCVYSNTITFSEKIRVIAENEEVGNNE